MRFKTLPAIYKYVDGTPNDVGGTGEVLDCMYSDTLIAFVYIQLPKAVVYERQNYPEAWFHFSNLESISE